MCGYLSTRWLFIYLSVHPVATLNWFKYIYDICSVQHSRANRPVKTRPVKTWFLSITIEDHDLNNPCAAVFEKLKKAVQDYFNEGGQCPKKIGLTFTGASRDKITRYKQQHDDITKYECAVICTKNFALLMHTVRLKLMLMLMLTDIHLLRYPQRWQGMKQGM